MDAVGLPGLFADAEDFTHAFQESLNKLSVEELPEFHRKLTDALNRSLHGNPKALADLALGLVICERLATNGEYKRAVKEVEELGTPETSIDHRRLIATLRAG